jgi:hypothetical protein
VSDVAETSVTLTDVAFTDTPQSGNSETGNPGPDFGAHTNRSSASSARLIRIVSSKETGCRGEVGLVCTQNQLWRTQMSADPDAGGAIM